MHDQHFDKQIKSKLLMLQIPYRESEWELFKKRLEPPLDLLAREHLAHYEDHHMEDDWSIFEEKLVKETFSLHTNFLNNETTDSFNNQPSSAYDKYIPDEFDLNLAQSLDPVVQNALDGYEASYEENDWEIFSAQFHGAFDTSVKKQLQGYEASYNPKHWQHMAEQLNLPFYTAIKAKFADYQVPFRRSDWWRMALRLKHRELVDSPTLQKVPSYAYGVAATILLLFALNIFSFLPRNSVLSPIGFEETAVNEAREGNEGNVIQEINTIDVEGAELLTSTNSENRVPLNVEEKEVQEQLVAFNESSTPNSLNTLTPDDYNEETVANIALPQQSLDLRSENEEVLISAPMPTPTQNSNPEAQYFASFASEVKPIERDRGVSLANGLSEFGKDQIVQFYAASDQINPEIRIGLIGGFNSSVAELTTKGRMGYQTGIRLEMAFNDEWSVISGIVYNQKEYQHRYLSYGVNTTQKLLDAQFKTVEIPLLVRHTFPPYGKTSLYIQAGIVTMISMEEFYRVYDPTSVANLGVETSTLRNLEPKNQLLNFHTYVGNVHSAMGLQYELTDNINLQLEPYFQLGLQRMGSEGKKLYSSGVNFGAVYRIGKKDS